MIEDKIKQEYEWQHREIGQPTLDELFSKINEALGIELWIWQKTYMTMGTYRQMGATTAQCLRVLLFSETTPLDYSSPPRTAREDCERQQLREIYQKLNEAGIQTRKVFWSREEKRRWYESQTVEKRIIKSNTAIIHLHTWISEREERQGHSSPCLVLVYRWSR